MAVYKDIRYGNSGAIGSDFGEAFLQSLTASSSNSLSFTTGIDTTFKIYRFRFINIHPSDNATRLKYNFSVDGGSNYNVAKTTISYQAYHAENDSGTGLVYETGTDLAQGTGSQFMGGDISNANDASMSGDLILYNPGSTTFQKHVVCECASLTNGEYATFHHTGSGYANTTNAIYAVQFTISTGTIDSGIIEMYGIKT